MTTYDVPGATTLKHVSHAVRGESWAQAMHRLAAKALIEGCEVFLSTDRNRATSTSSRDARRIYNIVIDHERKSGTCTCAAWQVKKLCKHVALALALIDELPSIDTPPIAARYAGIDCLTGEPFDVGAPITRCERGWMRVAA